MDGELLGTHWHTVPQIEGGCRVGPGKPDPKALWHGSLEERKTFGTCLNRMEQSCLTRWIKNISIIKVDLEWLSPHWLAFLAFWDSCTILGKKALKNKPLPWKMDVQSQLNLI